MIRCILLLLISCFTLLAAPRQKVWNGIAPGKGGNYNFISESTDGFTASIKSNGEKGRCGIIGCYTFDKVLTVKDAGINFTAVNEGKLPVQISSTVSLREGAKARAVHGRLKYTVAPGKTINISLPFKQDFGISDDKAHIFQVKLGVAVKQQTAGASGKISIKNVKISKAKITSHILITPGKGGEYTLTDHSPEEFSILIKRNSIDANATAQVCSNIDKAIHSQHKLQFSCRLSSGNHPVILKPVISYKNDKKTVTCWGPSIIVRGSTWKDHLLPLDSTYKLGDAVYNFRQLKFGVKLDGAKSGTEVKLDVKNIKIVSADNAGHSSGLNEIIVHPKKKIDIQPAPDALKVFVHFDNEDLATVYDGRSRLRNIKDNQDYPGFRYLLFEKVQKDVQLVYTPEEAQLIVYSAARPDKKLAHRIASAVKKGTNLIAAASVADEDIRKLLPVNVKFLKQNDYPERKKVIPAADTPLNLDGMSDAAFGIYSDVKVKNGKVLLAFEDGTPAVTEGKAGKGKVIYNALPIGVNLFNDYDCRDAFLLKLVSYLSKKELSVSKKAAVKPDTDGYYTGAGYDNFGRFGIILGDGLLTEEVNNHLAVINDSQEYRFTNSQTPKIKLDKWYFKIIGDNAAPQEVNWRYTYKHIGKVEFTAVCEVPAAWKGTPVQFAVQNGIDDTAEVFFNGKSIGKVTSDMSDYWQRPHRYTIPADLIKYNGENRIRIVAENIKGMGKFGSCPELLQLNPESSKPWKFVPDRTNWIGKGGIITEENGSSRRFDTSLAFPGIRWEIFSDRTDLELTNIAGYCAYMGNNGINIINLAKCDTIPTDWQAPWLLLFKDNADHPLLLVFSRKQDGIEISKAGGDVSGITLKRKNGIGMVLPLWITGRESVDTAAWKNGIPDKMQKQISFWMKRAFKYPSAADEYFKIDEKNSKVHIRTKFQYIITDNDWGISSPDYAPVSPLAYYSKDKLFESDEAADWKLVTSYGNYAAHDNSNLVNWSLPLPEMVYYTIPGIKGCDDVVKTGNVMFKNAAKWSCGGKVPVTHWSGAYPSGKNFPNCYSLNMHAWLMGLNQALIAPYNFDEESTQIMQRRIRKRFFEALEFFQYKAAKRWRQDPMSQIRYSVNFANRHLHATKYAPGTGTTINYADCNETAYMILSMARILADRHGQSSFVRANADCLRDAARLLLVSDDWGYMACHCRESGLSSTIDMLNCEYAAMMSLARVAEIAGDDALRAQALYRAARRMVPTITRLTFKEYAVKHKLAAYSGNISYGVGFAESGFSFRTKGFIPKELDLFDTSQGIPEELRVLYRKYAAKEIVPYFENIVKPSVYDNNGRYKLSLFMLGVIPHDASFDREQGKRLAAAAARESMPKGKLSRWHNDWPGMCFLPYLSQILCRIESCVMLHSSRDTDIRRFVFDPSTNTVELDVITQDDPIILLESELQAANTALNIGKNLIKVPLKPRSRENIKTRLTK